MFTPFWWTGINLLFNLLKLIIIVFLVHNITARHQLLEETVLPREDETEAYNMAIYLNICLTPTFLTFMVLETASFFLYTNVVTQTNLKYVFIFLLLLSH